LQVSASGNRRNNHSFHFFLILPNIFLMWYLLSHSLACFLFHEIKRNEISHIFCFCEMIWIKFSHAVSRNTMLHVFCFAKHLKFHKIPSVSHCLLFREIKCSPKNRIPNRQHSLRQKCTHFRKFATEFLSFFRTHIGKPWLLFCTFPNLFTQLVEGEGN
jgi:hypothetical protein